MTSGRKKEGDAVLSLKEVLISPAVTTLPKTNGRYMLDTDSCDGQLGWVLLQDQEGETNRTFGYWSPTLNDKKQNFHYNAQRIPSSGIGFHAFAPLFIESQLHSLHRFQRAPVDL